MANNPGFGPLMIGEQAYQEQQKRASTSGAGFGARMTGPAVQDLGPRVVDVPAETPSGTLAGGSYSVKDVRALLVEAPGRTYDLAEAEFNRPDGARKSVLRLLKETEEAKGDGARLALITACAQALGE